MTAQKIPHPSWIEVDLKQFRKNIEIVREYIGDALYCLPVKANAYGHGLCPIAKVAEEAGVDYLGVAHLQEGVQLRQAGIRIPILVLGAIHEDQISELIHHNLEFTISSEFKADLVAQKCRDHSLCCRVHLEVDTGMQRTGVRYATALSLYEKIKNMSEMQVVGIYSHLASYNGDVAEKQVETFHALMKEPVFQDAKLIRHLASSGGMTHMKSSHFDMVRPSLITFGYLSPDAPEALQGVAPCFSLKSKVSYNKIVEQGQGISYGHTYITPKRTRIVTIPIGYGDGLRRSLSNRGAVLIRGKRYPIVGTICMDQFMVDVGSDEVRVGDEVVLIGKQGSSEIKLTEMAQLSETIPYEILCLFNDRLPRIYRF